MKNALLLSLALIAFGPVAVEGQNSAGDQVVGLLMQTRTCAIRPGGNLTKALVRASEWVGDVISVLLALSWTNGAP
jgi:hypothetical protein